MWVLRTEQEKKDAQRRERKGLFRSYVLATIFVTILFAVLRGWAEAGKKGGEFLVPSGEWLRRLPVSFVVGLIISLFFIKYTRTETMVCPKCGNAKNNDGVNSCSCGGTFEKLLNLKWTK